MPLTASGLVDFALDWLEKTDQQTTANVRLFGSDEVCSNLGAALSSARLEFDVNNYGRSTHFTIKRSEEDDSPTLSISV